MSAIRPHRILLPASWAYAMVMAARNICYDARMLSIRHAGVPVIAVGNITAGGTGKTPLVAEIVGRLQARGRKVGVISRGYGRSSHGPVVVAGHGRAVAPVEDTGDEAAMLAQQLPDAGIVVAEHRIDAAEIAVRTLGVDVLVMDDGYQHRALSRDLDILVVDGRSDPVREPMLPAGLRREPLSGIRRAGLIGVSKVDTPEQVEETAARLRRWSEAPVFGFRTVVSGLFDLVTGEPSSLDHPKSVIAVSGIGDPKGFQATLRHAGMKILAERKFGDHHMFDASDVASVISTAKSTGAECVITTEKDAVRMRSAGLLETLRHAAVPILVLGVRVEVFLGGDLLDEMLTRVLTKWMPQW